MESWQKQLVNSITTVDQLIKKINLSATEADEIRRLNGRFRMSITPYYLSLIDKDDPTCPIRQQAVPSIKELNVRAEELSDPLGDERRSPIKGVTHRYPDRVLLYPTYNCAMYCRHCFRRRIVGQYDKTLTPKEMVRAINYIAKHPEIKEVILTGGDPLMLPDKQIKNLLRQLKEIKHLRWIRIHTRVYVTMPQRITPSLAKIFSSVRPLVVVTHANHPKEITPQFKKAAARTLRAGVIMLNQGVLMKGINDNVDALKELFYRLLESGVKPYYLHQCDLAQGISHFRTKVSDGIKLLRQMRGFITGLALPFYIIDTPGGFGKVPIDYNYLKSYRGKKIKLETFKGAIREYIEP